MKTLTRLLFFALLVAGCGNELARRTQVLVTIDAAASVKQRSDTLRIELFSGPRDSDTWTRAGEERFDTGAAAFVWPASLALLPKDNGNDRGFRLVVHAEKAGEEVLEVRAASYFIEGKTLLLELTLDEACIEYFGCDQGKTCIGQEGIPRCVDEKVDAGKLQTIDKPPRGQDNTNDGGSDRDGGRDASVSCSEVELCTNERDDDCDGQPDCADPDCLEQVSCVPAAQQLGILLGAAEDCPVGYAEGEVALYRGLRDLGCTGCRCGSAAPTTCSATLYTYKKSGPQSPNADCVIGTVADTLQVLSGACTQQPIVEQFPGYYVGWSVGTINVVGDPCSGAASGAAMLVPPEWAETGKLCLAKLGNGCGTNESCAPRSDAGRACRVVASGSRCADDSPAQEWFEGYTDTRVCGACKCSATGASCADLKVRLGSDSVCEVAPSAETGPLASGQKTCEGFPYSPPAQFVGSASDATCKPGTDPTGALTTAKPLSLCCE